MKLRFLSSLGLLAAILSTGITFAQEIPVPNYIRYRTAEAPDKPDILETAVSRFQKGDRTIDLIAMVHLADTDYFKKLDRSLTTYDTVLYEMVGGPYTEEHARMSRDAASGEGELAQVQALQQMAKNLLGLDFQLDNINYLAPNFVHADMTAEEFTEHSKGGEDLSNMLARAMQVAQSGKVPGLPATEAEANQMMMLMFTSVMTGNSNQLKRTLAPILAEAEAFISKLEGDQGSVLISKRNEIVIQKIHDTINGPDKNLAVIYGAGHMPDLETRLLKMGFNKTTTTWEPSWVINQGASQNQNPPNLNEVMKQVGGLMDMVKEAQPGQE